MPITIDDFKKSEIRVGTVKHAERVPDADKLIRLEVDLGEDNLRQILSGIAEYVEPEELTGRQLLFVTNLESRVIRGLVSNGMLLAGGVGDTFTLLSPQKSVPPGTRVN
ncbi:methionine--tRNA ligase subunit beta [Candidatus Kaiserbacteria bacterium CG10_big_fil_rev_8_21_14_0_10_45_20]|uniref:Methionine--tRNA ligase n=1 Tax=Candidatus Kaiserbacteria bacterium CG10_big_fil_rev_8_21_14_0_10_45_20 TaxID=1974607 RepID=A0A2H0UFT5_9BACT|nr:MAG: methionine--tRNA ligase subunit beta [Candidatus Kaiserbacteria bacterium CG10_big_fil_rev_8_21_14_0_10_45_20]